MLKTAIIFHVAWAVLIGTLLSQLVYVDDVTATRRNNKYYAAITGNLADSCTRISKVSQTVKGKKIDITVQPYRPKDAMCAQSLTPFKREIELKLVKPAPGEYVVEVYEFKESRAKKTISLP